MYEQNWYDNILQHFIDREKPYIKSNDVLCKCLFCNDIRERKRLKDIDEYND